MKREEKIGIYAGLVLIVAVVVVMSMMVWSGNFNNQNLNSSAPSSSVIPAGTTISVNTSSYQFYSFQTVYPETFSGAFSSNIPVGMYLITQSEFASVQLHNTYLPTNYIQHVSASTGFNFSWTIQSGSYVLLFMNQNGNSVANIAVVNEFKLSNYYV